VAEWKRGDKAHLHRTWYRTDTKEAEPEYVGAFSGTIPGSALAEREIVDVDWSERGWVQVTYLIRGESHADFEGVSADG
jgi:hypothetical protein